MPQHHRDLNEVDPILMKLLDSLAHGEKPWPLYLSGPAGSGKTSAALCLADVTATAARWTLDDLCDFVMNKPPQDVAREWEVLAEKALVILDEVGTRERNTDLPYRVLKKLADLRDHGQVATIFISNQPHKALQTMFDDRIASRLLAGTIFHLDGRDRRRAP